MTILDFLKTNTINNTLFQTIFIERFKDEEGNLLPFKIRSLTTAEYNDIQRICSKDISRFASEIVSVALVEPNLKDVELQSTYGVIGAVDLANKILLPGEVIKLSDAILLLSGFGTHIEITENEVKEAKKQ